MSLTERLMQSDSASSLGPNSERLQTVGNLVRRELSDDGYVLTLSSATEDARQLVLGVIGEVMAQKRVPLTKTETAQLLEDLMAEIFGAGPIEALLRNPDITEVMVANHRQVYVEERGRISLAPVAFESELQLRRVIDRLVARVGRRIDESSPMVDARLADGSRVNAVIPPISLDGASLTIRKFGSEPLQIVDLLAAQTLTQEVAELLQGAVEARQNIVVSGGTGTGKTTLLNVLSSFIPDSQRIVTIEDSAELQLAKPHLVRLESRTMNTEGAGEVTIRQLVRNALRMRPDRVVVGEVRDGAALDMLQAMNTGHEGGMTTVHANSCTDALSRLETMSLMAGLDLPMLAIREQVARAIHMVVQLGRTMDGRRRVVEVARVAGVGPAGIDVEILYKDGGS